MATVFMTKMRVVAAALAVSVSVSVAAQGAHMENRETPRGAKGTADEQAPPIQAGGMAYYISNLPGAGGSNSNAGISEKTPWFDFTPVNSRKLKPGDRILLARGATWNQEMTINDSGTADRWCEVGAYGSGPRPKIIRSAGPNDRGIRLNNPSYWMLRDIEVGNAGVGILVYYDTLGHEGLVFENIFVHDCSSVTSSGP